MGSTGDKLAQGSALLPMQSSHVASAILQARQKPAVQHFSSKALHNYSAYQTINESKHGGNPIVVTHRDSDIGQDTNRDQPKSIMPKYPAKQGKVFKLDLG